MQHANQKSNLVHLSVGLLFSSLATSALAETLEQKMSIFSGITLQHQLSVPSLLEYDTNPTLSSANKTGIWRFSLTPRYNIVGYSGRDTWNIGVGINLQRSSDKNISQDREDPSGNFAWSRAYEKGSFGLTASYNQSSSRISQSTPAGLFFADATSLSQSVGANFSRSITELLLFSVNANYQEQTFSGASVNSTNYTNQSINPSLTYILNEKMSTFVQTSYSHYQPSAGLSSDFISAVVGVNYKPSEKVDWEIKAGANQVYATQTTTGFQGGATFKYQPSSRHSYVVDYSRVSSPVGLGSVNQAQSSATLTSATVTNVNSTNNAQLANLIQGGVTGYVQSDNLRVSGTYNLSEYSDVGATYSYSKNNDLNRFESQQLAIWAAREISQNWVARLTYSHKMSSSNLTSADGDVIGASITYNISNF